jgi:hypothetical protein
VSPRVFLGIAGLALVSAIAPVIGFQTLGHPGEALWPDSAIAESGRVSGATLDAPRVLYSQVSDTAVSISWLDPRPLEGARG